MDKELVLMSGNDVDMFLERSKSSALDCVALGDKGFAKQSFKEECDINTIVRRFGLDVRPVPEGTYAWTDQDFSGVTDFRSALELVVMAEDSFMTLPASVRMRFDNDPGKFVTFSSDPKNAEELVALGLATKRPEVAPVKVEVVTTPVVADSSGVKVVKP